MASRLMMRPAEEFLVGTRDTLRSVLQATRWTEDDLRRLGLLL